MRKFIQVLVFCLLLSIVSAECSPYCRDCINNYCYGCMKYYLLANGNCTKIGIGTGAVVGIVIGCLVGGSILVIALLCLVVWCSQTVEQRVEVVEATTADVYYLPPSQHALVLPNGNLAHQNQNYIGYPNAYPQSNQMLQPQLKRFPLQQTQTVNSRMGFIDNTNCTVCLSNRTNVRLTPCGHQFHINCLTTWFNRTKSCPNCNSKNFQGLIQCNRCGNFNQDVTFCATGCQKPNHNQCFMQRNQNKLTCRNCAAGSVIQPYTINYR